MKKIYQTDNSKATGNCVNACIASIFEIGIDTIPNFWKETQDSFKFWELINKWSSKNLKHKCILVVRDKKKKSDFYFEDILCVGIYKHDNGDEHAIVWKNGVIHNPSGYLCTERDPDTFMIFCPIIPKLESTL